MHTIHWEKIVLLDSGVLLDLGVKSLLICATAGMAHFIFRKRSASFCHSIWALCMASLLALPIAARFVPQWTPFTPSATQPALVQAVSPGGVVLSAVLQDPPGQAGPLPILRAFLAESDKQFGPLPVSFAGHLVAVIWLFGCAFLIAQVTCGYFAACLTARVGLPVDCPVSEKGKGDGAVQFIQTQRVRVPMLLGVFRPVILLPTDFDKWPEDRRWATCRHELAHLNRRDCLTHLTARLACALFWLNPFVWIGARLMAALRERACDELVVRTGIKRSDYAEHLLEVARRFKAVPAIGLGVVSSNRVSVLEKRIRYILQGSDGQDASALFKVVGLAVGLVLLTSVAGFQAHGLSERSVPPLAATGSFQLVVVKGKWANALECAAWTISDIGKTNQATSKLMPEAPVRGEGAPSFSPDRKQIVFAMWDAVHSILMVRELQTGVERRLSTGLADCDSPSWSPDGSRIAFVGGAEGRTNCHIFTMNLDGTDRRQLTHGDHQFNWYPSYSPDGKRIVWEREDGEGNDEREIYVMNVDGTNQINLTRNDVVDHHPAWSPDGSKIAFMSRRENGNAEIYVMNADGTNPVNLTKNPARDSEPAWSPDGQWIAFTRSEDASFTEFSSMDVYVMKADGTEQKNITRNKLGISCWNPVWK
jgi:beta-lactamase regulating signal transducer with metallopeptidase domain